MEYPKYESVAIDSYFEISNATKAFNIKVINDDFFLFDLVSLDEMRVQVLNDQHQIVFTLYEDESNKLFKLPIGAYTVKAFNENYDSFDYSIKILSSNNNSIELVQTN